MIKTYWSSSFWPKVFFVCFVKRIQKLVVKLRQTEKNSKKKFQKKNSKKKIEEKFQKKKIRKKKIKKKQSNKKKLKKKNE
jgi:hypothetical protein